MIQSVNPSTGELIQSYKFHDDAQLDAKIAETHEAFLQWRSVSMEERSERMKRIARILLDRKDEYAALMTAEMGKTLNESKAEVEKCIWVCEFYAEKANAFLADELVETEATKSYVTYQPIGIVFAIMPWNYPFWQVFRFAAPALMAGNTVVLKHAPNVPGCAQVIEELFEEAGFIKNAFTNLIITNDQASQVIEDERVKAVTLTGSTRAGKAVAAQAGSYLKKCVLELGGNDPYLILEDADLDFAIQVAVASRLKNNGQSCISAKRFIVPQSIKQEFEEKLVKEMSSYTFGDPTDDMFDLGPLVGASYRDTLADQVDQSISAGASCLLGGEVPHGPGFFYPPTVLTNVSEGMPAFDEELFGPVASIIAVEDEDEAIQVANQTKFGLGAAIFSKDVERAEQIAATWINAGSCFVNAMVQSDPRLPFGGINESGYGRELSYHGIREFVNVKTVYIK